MLSEARVAESMSAVGRLVKDIRQFGSQASLVTIEDVFSIQSDTTALPGSQAHAVQTKHRSSGLFNRGHNCQPAARSQPQPESKYLVQDVEQRSTGLSASTTGVVTPRHSLSTKVSLRLNCRKAWRNIRTCYTLIFFGLLTIIGSLVPAVWRSIHSNDISGGFNLAQYTLGIGVFVVGCVVAIHSRKCTCWSSSQAHWKGREPGDDNTAELHFINSPDIENTRSTELEIQQTRSLAGL